MLSFKSINLINNMLTGLGKPNITALSEENHNYEYEGISFSIADNTYRSRLAKLTPSKKGYFVVFWKKNDTNKNQAYSYDESPEKIIISVIDNELQGQFIFPKSILLKQEVLRTGNSKGKMAIRVYPSWVNELNQSAIKTQEWQREYFIDLSNEVDNNRLTKLYFSKLINLK